MKTFYLLLSLTLMRSGMAQAENFSEQIKITGFHCDYGQAAVELRSLKNDRVLYLAENDTGTPRPFQMFEEHCEGLIKNLSAKLKGQILEARFQAEDFSRKEQVSIPPENPCRPGRTKCDDEGSSVEKIFQYERIETSIDGYRFFNETKIGEQP